MNTTHTPGKWSVKQPATKYEHNRGIEIVGEGDSGVICLVDRKGKVADDLTFNLKPEGQPEANARLIAAAPELLAACLKVANDPYTTCTCAEVVRAAITKAIGGAS